MLAEICVEDPLPEAALLFVRQDGDFLLIKDSAVFDPCPDEAKDTEQSQEFQEDSRSQGCYRGGRFTGVSDASGARIRKTRW